MREITGQQVINQARKYLGVPYGHQGYAPPGAELEEVDCAHLILRVGQDLDQLPLDLRLPAYSQQMPLPRNFTLLDEHLIKLSGEPELDLGLAQPGDVVVFDEGPVTGGPPRLRRALGAKGLKQRAKRLGRDVGLTQDALQRPALERFGVHRHGNPQFAARRVPELRVRTRLANQ